MHTHNNHTQQMTKNPLATGWHRRVAALAPWWQQLRSLETRAVSQRPAPGVAVQWTQWGRWNCFDICVDNLDRTGDYQVKYSPHPVVIGLTLHSLDPGDICFYKPEYPFYRVFCSTKKMFSFCPGNKLGLLHYFETLTLNSGKAKTWLKGSSQWDR